MRPERALADVASWGGQVVSLNPLHDTLEDFFVRQVTGATTDRGLGLRVVGQRR
jgi:hypothetical protein